MLTQNTEKVSSIKNFLFIQFSILHILIFKNDNILLIIKKKII
jgi:hypothetical protein